MTPAAITARLLTVEALVAAHPGNGKRAIHALRRLHRDLARWAIFRVRHEAQLQGLLDGVEPPPVASQLRAVLRQLGVAARPDGTLISASQAVVLAGISCRTLYNWTASGVLPYHASSHRRRRLFRPDEVLAAAAQVRRGRPRKVRP